MTKPDGQIFWPKSCHPKKNRSLCCFSPISCNFIQNNTTFHHQCFFVFFCLPAYEKNIFQCKAYYVQAIQEHLSFVLEMVIKEVPLYGTWCNKHFGPFCTITKCLNCALQAELNSVQKERDVADQDVLRMAEILQSLMVSVIKASHGVVLLRLTCCLEAKLL